MEHRPVHMVLPSPVSWIPDVCPSSEEETPEKTPPGAAFRPDWETQFTEGKARQASLLQRKRGLTAPRGAGFGNVSEGTGSLLTSAQLLPFHSN